MLYRLEKDIFNREKMIVFIFAHLFAVTVYDTAPQNIVGVGADVPAATTYMAALEDYRKQNPAARPGGPAEAVGHMYNDLDHTICVCDGYLVCLPGTLINEDQIRVAAQKLCAAYKTVFDGKNLRNPLPTGITKRQSPTTVPVPASATPPSVVPPDLLESSVQAVLGQLIRQKPDARARIADQMTQTVFCADGLYSSPLPDGRVQPRIFFYDKNNYYYWLTNFFSDPSYPIVAQHPITRDLISVCAAELLFQAFKGVVSVPSNQTYINAVLGVKSAIEAFNLGGQLQLSDWRGKKQMDAMWYALTCKFDNQYYKNLLRGTGDAWLFENSPKDKFWGIGLNGFGLNMLGKLLMLKRAQIRKLEGRATFADGEILQGHFPELLQVADAISAQQPSPAVSLPSTTGLPTPVFRADGVFDPAATLKPFGVDCVRLWGKTQPQNLWIITKDAATATALKQKNLVQNWCVHQTHQNCIIVPDGNAFIRRLAQSGDAQKTLDGLKNNGYFGQNMQPK